MSLFRVWEQLVDCICRPPRDDYSEEDLKGGRRGVFAIGARKFKRVDFELTNVRNERLKCSHWLPEPFNHAADKIPVVVYCHCNSGSRRDSEEALFTLLPSGISVFAMDFAGSGLSDGKWVTLGAREVDDLEAVVKFLRTRPFVSTIGLWGRSMGAVTALLYAHRDPTVAGIVLDSPFSRLTDLMMEIVAHQPQRISIPKSLLKIALAMMRRSVRKRAGFDLTKVAPIDTAPEAFIPALFSHAQGDDFVPKHHSERLQKAYGGDSNYITFPGDHNSRRPPFFYSSVSIFFHNVLQQHATALEGGSKSAPGGIAVGRPNGTAAVYLKPATEPSSWRTSRDSSAHSHLVEERSLGVPPALAGSPSTTASRDASRWRSRTADAAVPSAIPSVSLVSAHAASGRPPSGRSEALPSRSVRNGSVLEAYQDPALTGFDLPAPTAHRHDGVPELGACVPEGDLMAALAMAEADGSGRDSPGSEAAPPGQPLPEGWEGAAAYSAEEEDAMLARAIEESLRTAGRSD